MTSRKYVKDFAHTIYGSAKTGLKGNWNIKDQMKKGKKTAEKLTLNLS